MRALDVREPSRLTVSQTSCSVSSWCRRATASAVLVKRRTPPNSSFAGICRATTGVPSAAPPRSRGRTPRSAPGAAVRRRIGAGGRPHCCRPIPSPANRSPPARRESGRRRPRPRRSGRPVPAAEPSRHVEDRVRCLLVGQPADGDDGVRPERPRDDVGAHYLRVRQSPDVRPLRDGAEIGLLRAAHRSQRAGPPGEHPLRDGEHSADGPAPVVHGGQSVRAVDGEGARVGEDAGEVSGDRRVGVMTSRSSVRGLSQARRRAGRVSTRTCGTDSSHGSSANELSLTLASRECERPLSCTAYWPIAVATPAPMDSVTWRMRIVVVNGQRGEESHELAHPRPGDLRGHRRAPRHWPRRPPRHRHESVPGHGRRPRP